jgi:peptidoglycan/LPS O-acetylase OafA/YrhL
MQTETNSLFSFSNQRMDSKKNGFGWMRLALALLVVVSHSNWINGQAEFGLELKDIHGFTSMGTFAVFGFFIISGFLITGSYINTQDIFVFFKKRILRLAPAFWMCLFLTIIFFAPLYYLFSGRSILDYFINDFAKGWVYFWSNITIQIQSENYGNALDTAVRKEFNGPLWSLIFEVRAYILLGLLGFIGVFRNRFLILIPAIFFWFAHYNVVFNAKFTQWFGVWVGDYKLAILFSYFFIASVFYIWKDKISMDWKLFVPSVGLVLYAIIIDQFSLFAPLFLTYCVLYLAHKLPTPKWLENLGDMSYGVYIYSWPIQNLLVISGFSKFGLIPFTIVSIVLSLIAGYLSYNLVEKKFLVRRS